MANENKIYITAGELAEMLDISIGHAYKIIRRIRRLMKTRSLWRSRMLLAEGRITIRKTN